MKALPRRLAHAMYLLACEYHVIYKNRMYFMAIHQDHIARRQPISDCVRLMVLVNAFVDHGIITDSLAYRQNARVRTTCSEFLVFAARPSVQAADSSPSDRAPGPSAAHSLRARNGEMVSRQRRS